MGVRRLLLRAVLPIRAAIRVSVLAALYPLPAAAIAAQDAYTQSATPEMKAEMERLREQAKEDRFDKSIAEAKLEVIAAGNGRLENWLGIFGILITVLFAGFGIVTFRQSKAAAQLIKDEVQVIKTETEAYRDSAKATAGKIEDVQRELSEGAKATLDRPPSSTPSETPLPDEQLQELKDAARTAADTPRKERTAQDFRVLMYQASREKRWQDSAELAEGMAFLHGNNPDDLAFALFSKAYAQSKLKNYELSVNYWAEYARRSPNDYAEDRASALYNWGNDLSAQAKLTHGDTADALFAQAYEKYDAAIALKPDNHDALCNLGLALSNQAQTKGGDTAGGLFAQAYEKHAAALGIKPDMHEAFFNWGIALSTQAIKAEGEQLKALLDQAEGKFLHAEALKPGSCADQLKELQAMRGDYGA